MTEKTYPVRVLPPAQGELEQIAQLYFSLAGAQYAKKLTDKIFNALEQVSKFPYPAPLIKDPELRRFEYRFIVVEKYIIIYRLIENTIFVYHIFDGRSDYPTLFRSELLG